MARALNRRREQPELASIDHQQVVCGNLKVCKRNLNSAGSSGQGLARNFFKHRAVIVETTTGERFLIDKGVDEEDDINYKLVQREENDDRKSTRIAKITGNQSPYWIEERSVPVTKRGVTLETLLIECGQGYSVAMNNCWNGVERMCAAVNEDEEDKRSWQEEAAIGAGIAVGAAAVVIGIGAALFGALSQSEDKEKSKKKNYS